MKKYDPNGVFMNNFGRRVLGTSTTMDIDPLEVHCGIRDNCICSQDSDCPTTHTCTNLPGYSQYNVCQTIGETRQPQLSAITTNFNNFSMLSWMKQSVTYLQIVVVSIASDPFCLLRY